jgi:hypothetical protein
MIWITKYRHNKIVEGYEEHIKNLTEALNRKENFEKIMDKLVDKTNDFSSRCLNYVDGSSSVMSALDDTVPRYVEDYFGGKVIKQEATNVTILDPKGKATYGLTKKPANKGKDYLLVIK